MSLKIGRLGQDITIDEHGVDVQRTGDKVAFSGDFTAYTSGTNATVAYTAAELKTLALQVEGLDDGEEPEVPVESTVDPTLDGMYRVISAQTELGPGKPGLPWSVQLERLPHRRGSIAEATMAYAVKENNHALIAGTVFIGIPAAARGLDLSAGVFAATVNTRTGPGGSPQVITAAADVGGDFAYPMYEADPTNWYGQQAEILAGTDLHRVIGLQVPSSPRWRLSNGLLRIDKTGTDTSAADLDLTITGNDGSAWGTAWPFEVGQWSIFFEAYGEGHGWHPVTNNPERASVRQLFVGTSGSSSWEVGVTFGLRRGSHLVELEFDSRILINSAISFPPPAGVWASAHSGVRCATNDVNSNRWVMHSTASFTLSTNVIYRTTDDDQWFAALGMIRGGHAPGTIDDSDDLRDQFYAAVAAHVQVSA